MLSTRLLSIAVVLLLACAHTAMAQGVSPSKQGTKGQQLSETQKSAPQIDTSSLEKAIRESIKEASQSPDAHAEEKLAIDRQVKEYTGQLAAYTEELSRYTMWLVIATVVVALIGIWQGFQLKRTVDTDVETERARLHPASLICRIPPEHANGKVSVGYTISNIGRMPCVLDEEASVVLVAESFSGPLPSMRVVKTIQTPIGAGDLYPPQLVGLNSPPHYVDTESDRALTAEELNNLRAGRLFIFFYGWITYRDFLGFFYQRYFCFKVDKGQIFVHGRQVLNHETRRRDNRNAPGKILLRRLLSKLST